MTENWRVQAPSQSRFHYIDFSRALLLILGIVLHAAWLCRHQSAVFQRLVEFIHGFRMPGFFLIAGFFSAMTLANYSPEEFLGKRVRRLAVPFLVFTLIDILVNVPNHNTWGDYSVEFSGSYWSGGDWLEHLWFLATLISYVLIVFIAHKIYPAIDSRLRRLKLDLSGFIALLAISSFVFQHFERAFPARPWFFLDQIKFFDFCAWFGAGYLFFLHRELFERFQSLVILNAASAILIWVIGPYLTDLPFGKLLLQLFEAVYVLNICGLIFWIARRFFGSENRFVRSASDASYTMYLVHWPLVIVLNRLLNQSEIPIGLVFLLLLLLASAFSYGFHIYVVRRSDLLMFLLNGRSLNADYTDVAERTSPPVMSA